MNKKIIFWLTIIILIACFFRLYKLESIPPGLYPDVAVNGNNALDSIKNNNFKVFYPDNNGREGLIMWLDALAFMLFRPSVWALKIFCAITGILTVLGTYLLAKQLFKNVYKHYEAIALLSSFFIAISFWHVNFSRIGFRAIMVPFFIVYSVYFALRGFETPEGKPSASYGAGKKIYNFILSGIFAGLGFYTYISYRFIVLLFFIIFLFYFLKSKKENSLKQFFKFSAIIAVFTILTALPLGIYFLNNPQDFFGRASEVSIFKNANPVLAILKSIGLHLAMFNFYGDSNWRHNYAGAPELFWPVGIFFLIGFVFSAKEAFRKNKAAIILLSWFFIFLLPGFLSSEGIPHASRTIGVLPVPYIFAGIGGIWVFNKLKALNQKKILYSGAIFLLIIIAFFEYNRYFIDWANKKEVKDAFSQNYLNLGNYLNSLPDNVPKYVVANDEKVMVNNLPARAQTPMFIERLKYGKTRAEYILPEDINNVKKEKGTVILVMDEDSDFLIKLLSLFPKDMFYSYNGFWIMELKNNY